MLMGNYRKGTPSAGLDVITGTIPIHLKIESLMLSSAIRLDNKVTRDWPGKSFGKMTGHIKYSDTLLEKAKIERAESDHLDGEIIWENNFHVIKSSFSKGDDIKQGIRCYTDGSLINNRTGLGAIVYHNNSKISAAIARLSNNATVFQAEVIAYQHAVIKLTSHLNSLNYKPDKVIIMSDSQAAIQALIADKIHSKAVKESIIALNKLGKITRVEIHWIAAHVNHEGNEDADKLAKEGANLPRVGIPVPLAACSQKLKIRDHIHAKWKEEWSKLKSCRQTKIWFPEPNLRKSKELMKQNRVKLSVLVRMLSGHNHLRKHNYLTTGPDDTAGKACRFCKLEDETSSHLITDCDVLWPERADAFKAFFLNTSQPKWEVKELIHFLAAPRVASLEEETRNIEH
jgi:ribonuclease HI